MRSVHEIKVDEVMRYRVSYVKDLGFTAEITVNGTWYILSPTGQHTVPHDLGHTKAARSSLMPTDKDATLRINEHARSHITEQNQ